MIQMKDECRPYLPPEWAHQSAVMLTWPRRDGDFGENLAAVEACFGEIAKAISDHEKLLVSCHDGTHLVGARKQLESAGVNMRQVHFTIAPSDDIWVRDHGPLTVVCASGPQLLDFRFNGWGGKYDSTNDDALTETLFKESAFGETPLERVELVLEGGAIEVDGSGSLMATRRAVLSASRNPGLSQQEIEKRLAEHLGIMQFLWLDHGGLAGDDTDGHIDTLARFCSRDTIAYVKCLDHNDKHYEELKNMEKELKAFRTITGEPFNLIALPLPAAKYNADGKRLPATYANFLIINEAVLVPIYRDEFDADAITMLSIAFPDHKIIAIDCLPLITQYGSLHCATMQLPEGVLPGA